MLRRVHLVLCPPIFGMMITLGLAQDVATQPPRPASSMLSEDCRLLGGDETNTPCLTVTADRLAQTDMEQTHAVSVLTAEDLEIFAAETLGEALQYLPGVHFASRGGVGTSSLMRVRGSKTEQTLVLLNGMPMNDPSTPGRNFHFNHTTLGDVERIELVRGAQSVAYGSTAMAGVVNIITQQPTQPGTSVQAQANYGSRNSVHLRTGLRHAQDAMAFALQASQYETEGFSRVIFGDERDGTKFSDLNGQMKINLLPELETQILGTYRTTHTQYDAFGRDSDSYEEERDDYSVQANWLWQPNEIWTQRFKFGIMRLKRADEPAGTRHIGTRHYIDQLAQLNLWDSRATLSLGGHGEWEAYDDKRTLDERASLAGGHVQVHTKPVENLHLNIGVRMEAHETFGGITNWQLGASYRLADWNIKFRTAYGTAFRAPSLYQLYNDDFGNDQLRPEKARHFDVGIEQSFWDNIIEIAVGYFYLQANQQIAWSGGKYFNIDKVKSHGSEISLTWQLWHNLVWRSDYSFVRAVNEPRGDDILLSPKHSWHNHLQWRHGAASLHTSIRFVGKQKDFGDVAIPSYAVWRIGGSYQWRPEISLEWRVENLLDKDYQPIATYRGEPRGVFVGFKAQW